MTKITLVVVLICVAQAALAKPFAKTLGLGRIVEGEEVVPNSIPYQVGMFIQAPEGTTFCGGTLLTRNFVLTAAHCVDQAISIEVVLGAHRVQDSEKTQVRLTAAAWLYHEKWDPKALRDDVAVVVLPSPAPLNENIQLVTLPKRSQEDEPFADMWSRASGWGKTSNGAITISPYLQKVDLWAMTTEDCNVYNGGWITFQQICAIGEGKKNPCEGDSGGPLVIDDVQVGIASYVSSKGCEAGYPTVFTRVSKYLDWIETHSDYVAED